GVVPVCRRSDLSEVTAAIFAGTGLKTQLCAIRAGEVPSGLLQQTIVAKCAFESRLAGVVERRERQTDFARIATEELHRRLDRNGIRRQPEQIAAERKQAAVSGLRLRQIAGREGGEHGFDVLRDDVAHLGNDAATTE